MEKMNKDKIAQVGWLVVTLFQGSALAHNPKSQKGEKRERA